MRLALGKKQKISLSVIAAGVVISCIILSSVFTPPGGELVSPELPVGACEGFTDAKLDARFAGNAAGMDGSSWATAYVFEGLVVEQHGWTFVHTTRYVIISGCTFRHLVDHGVELDHAKHVRVNGSTFWNGTLGISLEEPSDVLVANSSFRGNRKAVCIDGGSECTITNNTFSNNGVAIKSMPFTSGATITLNHFTGNLAVAEEPASVDNFWSQGGLGNYYPDYFTKYPSATLGAGNPQLDGLCDPAAGKVYIGMEWYAVANQSWDCYPLVFVPAAPPSISATTPASGAIIGNSSASFAIILNGTYIVAAWYRVGQGLANYTIAGPMPVKGISAPITGTINQSAWDLEQDGEVAITFFARSITGAEGSTGILVTRDTTAPAVNVTSPGNATSHRLSPSYSLSITELHVASITSTVAGMTSPIPASGTIPATSWDAAPQGEVLVQFCVTDGAGNLAKRAIVVFKDTSGPTITFTNIAQHALAGATPPVIAVSAVDARVGVVSGAFYVVGESPTQYPLELSDGANGTKVLTFAVDGAAWMSVPEGNMTITVACADALGNLASGTLWLERDLSAPVIQVLAPLTGYTVGNTAGYFALLIDDPHLGGIWWSLDGGATRYPVTEWTGAAWAGFFAGDEWARHFNPGGSMTVTFFANDTLGNVARADITVQCEASPVARSPLGDFMGDPVNWLLLGVVAMLGLLVHAHYRQDKNVGGRLR